MQVDAVASAIWRQQIWRGGIGLLVLGLCAFWLVQRLQGLDGAAMAAAFAAVTPPQWAGALICSAISYLAIGQYDLLLLRHLALPHDPAQARRAGITALALSQTLGLGPITGALVRWRMLPGLSLAQAFRLTLAVSLSFLLAAAFVGGLVLAALRGGWALAAGGAGLLALAALLVWRPSPAGMRWPNLLAAGGMIACAAADLAGAAAALWWVLPAGIGFGDLLSGFLPALAAGLVSGAPAGLGAFDLLILESLPGLRPEDVLAAILAWRLAYFVGPSIVAAGVMAHGPRPAAPHLSAPTPPPIWPEATLAQQGHLSGLPGTNWVVGRTGHALVAFGDVAQPIHALDALRAKAKDELRLPALYKAPARLAARCRRLGMSPLLLGYEAWLDPTRFTLTSPAHAGLRRKLRQSVAAQVSVAHDPCPKATDLAPVAQAWAREAGGEHGFSMGRFDHGYLAAQRVYIARHHGTAVAFVSFHHSADAWVLDLMRARPSVPPGTMHALVACALADAARARVQHLGLAAVPVSAFSNAPLWARIAHKLGPKRVSGAGLYQFKASFAPRWQPIYLCAANRPAVLASALSIARAIHRPAPLAGLAAA